MKKLFFALLCMAVIPAVAQAADPAVISFSAVTGYTDGTAIPAGTAISYNIYQGLQGQPKLVVANITTTGTTIATGLVTGSTYCFSATAVVNGVEGAQSNEACKKIKPTPNSLVITVI